MRTEQLATSKAVAEFFNPTQTRNSGRAKHCWIARCGWVPRRGASCRLLGRGDSTYGTIANFDCVQNDSHG